MLTTFQHEDVIIGHLGNMQRTSYLYYVDGMLVDTGPPKMLQHVIPFYKQTEIDFVCLTHSHEDHCGTAPWLANECGIPVYAHKNAIDICSKPATYPRYRQFVWGLRDEGFPVQPIQETFQTRNYTWEVIETPGHAYDQVAYYNREKGWLFAGDIYVTPKTRLILSWEHIRDTMNSLQRVLTYDFDHMFCGHAGHVKDGKRMLQMKFDDLEEKKVEILYLHEKGWSVDEITKKLFPKHYPLIDLSEEEWHSKYIVETMIDGFASKETSTYKKEN